MTAKTYTLADRVAAHLSLSSSDWPAFDSVLVDAVAGDRLRDSGHHEDPAREIAADHRALREKG